jgi:hypothetical protein
MLTAKVTEISHLSAHPSVPVVVTSSGHAVKLTGLPVQPKGRLL